MTARSSGRPAHWPSVPQFGKPSRPAAPVERPTAAVRSRTTAAAAIASDAVASPWTTPFLLVLAYLFVDFARPHDWLPPLQALRPGMLVQSACIIALIKYKQFSLDPVAKCIVGFLATMAIMVPFATNNGFAFSFTKDFAIFLLGAAIPIMTFAKTTTQVSILFRFWLVINAILSIYGITHGGRGLGSFLGDENDFCLAVNVALPYAFFMLGAARSRFERLALVGSIVLSLSAVVTSMSRGGFLGLVMVGVACWLRSPRKVRSGLIVLFAAGVLFLTVPQSYWKEMQTIETADQEGDTGATRLYFWGIGWKMFKDHPIFGVGPVNFNFNSFHYEDPRQAARGFHIWGKAAHSIYFTLLPEEGIVGTALFVAIIIGGWRLRRGIGIRYRALVRDRPEAVTQTLKEMYVLARAVDVSLLAFLVTGAFISALYYPHFWLIAAFSVVLRRAFDAEMREIGAAAPAPAAPRPAWSGSPR